MLNTLLSYAAFLFIRAISLTYRYEFRNSHIKDALAEKSQNYIYAVWHNNIIGTILSHVGSCHVVIVSASKDGDVIAKILTLLGNRLVRGSSTRGGRTALISMIRTIKDEGLPGAISVDGPLGPLYRPKKGIVEVAKETGAVILPLASYPCSFWRFEKAWDKFRLPKPFSKIILQFGEPIKIDSQTNSKEFPEFTDLVQRSLLKNEEEIVASQISRRART